MTTTTDRYPIIETANLAQSLRDSGYKSPASAGAELCDNAFQAEANTFQVIIEEHTDGAGKMGKPNSQPKGIGRVIFSDDGNGMDLMLLRNAVRFGYTTRFDDRGGMGRFGMGLPNASISQAKIFSVYSKTVNGVWHYVRLDLDDIATERVKEVPMPVAKEPPQNYIIGAGTSGTIVIWENLDRLNLRYQNPSSLQTHFITEFSRIFRYFLIAGRTIIINAPKSIKTVLPFDPLYLMNEAQYSGATQHGDAVKIQVTKDDGTKGVVEVRFSLTPINWQVSPDGVAIKADAKENKERRLNKNRGVSFIRADREIDFIPGGLKGSHPMNMWWSAEVSFPPTLDELFGIEFTKQRVVLTEEMRNLLLDKAFKGNAATLNDFVNNRRPKETPPISASAAEEIVARMKGKLRPMLLPIRKGALDPKEDERLLGEAAAKRRRSDETKEDAKKRIKELPFLFQSEDRPGAPFYRIETHGSQNYIYLNRNHTFYQKVYIPLEDAGGNALTGFHLLLSALAQAEVQSGSEGRIWYEDERQNWSSLLTGFLRDLAEYKPDRIIDDLAESV